MKGLTHFISGVAMGSFIPAAVRMANNKIDNSLILGLGGLFGIMPDTLDFKVGQFFSQADYDVDVDPNNLNPQDMAEQIAKGINDAWETGRYVKVQLYPIRLGVDLWRQYVVKFDGEKNEVVVVINEIVNTSQTPYLGTAPKTNRVGRCRVKGKMLETHGKPSVVDIMSGPQFGFIKRAGQVEVEFLPWHRTWSHSYVLGFILSSVVWVLASLVAGWDKGWLYGLVAFLCYAIHITLVGLFSEDDPVMPLTCIQFLFASGLAWAGALGFETFPASVGAGTWVALAYLAFGSTLVALTLMNLGIRHVTPARASILLATEALFGCLFGVLLQGDPFTLQIALGGTILTAAVVVSQTDPPPEVVPAAGLS